MDKAQRETVGRAAVEGLSVPGGMEPEEFLLQAALPADSLRERLLSFMVHEVRNPLASALWATEMLERRAGTPEAGDARSERMARLGARSLRRMRALLEDMFALERLPKRVPPGKVELGAAVQRALGPHDLEPAGLDIPVSGEQGLESPVSPLLTDRLLHAVFRRMKHAGEGGPVCIELRRNEEKGEVRVIRAGATKEVVDPPLLAPGGSEGGGTTFSLLLARAIAQRLGVELEVFDSPSGSTLVLTFPLY